MQKTMKLYSYFIKDELFIDGSVAASRVHLGKTGEKASPIQDDYLSVWVEGEAYNLQEIAKENGVSLTSIGSLLLYAEKTGKLKQILNKLDGYFCAAIYNKKEQKIKLISDRYGMRVLYWYFKDNIFAWGSGVKAILAIDGIDKTLDQSSYDCFMDLGYLMGEHTWFEHIKLIKPATVLEFDMLENKVKQEYYWTWKEIKPSNLTFNEAVDKLGNLFIEAVAKRFNPNEKIGISLSGGLDSRAIYAAVNHLHPDYTGYAYTFGIPACDDITIAEKVINVYKKWKHQSFHFSNENWFKPRFSRVWNTDGMMNLLHMHGSEFSESIMQNCDINLNGYAGDAVFGGSLISHRKDFQDQKPNKKNASAIYGKHAEQYDDDFFNINHFDHYLYMNRVRRFTNGGSINLLVAVEQRKPFFDNKVMELIFSLPDSYRTNNKLYSAMLHKFFPEFFKDIPWQNTCKIAAPTKTPTLFRRAFNKLIRETKKLLDINNTKSYTDYPEWIRNQSIAEELQSILGNEEAKYKMLTNCNLADKYLKPHLQNKLINNSEKILRAATIEIYLQKALSDISNP
jgi:asparagine synthase (glutamine-hydrolysing)